ncbi:hypothetical protein U3516DRAFT_897177 [Neocallimastix sp. 'constans']
MLFCFILAIYTCFGTFFLHGYTRTISIESIDISDSLIYHFDTTTSYTRQIK